MPSARTSRLVAAAPAPVSVARAFVPSALQQDIFDWFAYAGLSRKYDEPDDAPPCNLLVRARAGTGKTETILRGIDVAPEQNILLAAFNKKNQEDLAARLTNPRAEALTLHALGFQAIRAEFGRVRVCDKYQRREDLADRVCGGLPYGAKRLVAELVTKAREIQPQGATLESLTELALDFDCVPPPGDALTVEMVVGATLKALAYARTPASWASSGIDYADMIFLPIALELIHPVYDMVVIDEYQDMTRAQASLAHRALKHGGRFVVVGDDRQCQPAGAQVQTMHGTASIESLKAGDSVISWDRHSQSFIQSARVNETAVRNYRGEMLTVTAGVLSTRCTPGHKWLVRWTAQPTDSWLVYLMRRGKSFRVGQCQMFRRARHGAMLGLHTRVNQELADEAWILSIHDTREDALVAERVVSARYGLPELCFRDTNHHMFSAAMMYAVWSALGDLTEKARRCLSDHKRDISYPLYRRIAPRLGRQTLFETEACNLLPHYMSVPVAPIVHAGFDKPQRRTTKWLPIDVSREAFDGPVYSLDIATHHKYVADGLVTCNCIYQFRGADTANMAVVKEALNACELPLSITYRCPRAVVTLAQRYVPDYQPHPEAPLGTVDEVEDVDALVADAAPGDFILSRTNAPLARVALRLLRAGTPAKIQGRDIGAGLKATIRALAKGDAAHDIPAFLRRLRAYEAMQTTRLLEMRRDERVPVLHDKCETLRWLADNAGDVANLTARIDALFTDEPGASVICSTVHKAKGLEAERVWVLRSTFFIPSPCECGHRHPGKACGRCGCEEHVTDEGHQLEESNIYYVAITRTKARLTFCQERF